MSDTLNCGDPYRLAGNRIAFVNWHFVQSGMGLGGGWRMENGETAGLGSERLGGDPAVQWHPGVHSHGVRLVTEPARRCPPLFVYNKPWEEHGLSAAVMKDGGVYRAWASTGLHSRGISKHSFSCYLESDDGYAWRKPELDVIPFAGGASNIIDDKLGYRLHPITPFVDPAAPPAERYKCVSEWEYSRGEYEAFLKRSPAVAADPKAWRGDMNRCLAVIGATSPDGLRWTLADEPLTMTHSDTSMVGYYDRQLRKYVVYFRDYLAGAQAQGFERVQPHGSGFWKRAIGRAESDEFRLLHTQDDRTLRSCVAAWTDL